MGYYISRKSNHNFLRAYDIDKSHQTSFEKFHSIKIKTNEYIEILNDNKITYVYIASNHHSHTNYAIDAIKHNKTVYIEKPISVTMEQFRNLTTIIKTYNGNIYAGYNRPFSAAIIDLKNSIKKFENKPFSMNYFISGHLIEKDHWYRNAQEGTRICGNVGHWLDLTIYILSWRKLPNEFKICISYSNSEEIDDNISITITTEYLDIVSIMLTSRCEPFEGINETINFQYDNTIAKIDDFRKMTIWQDEILINKRYWPKDVGHKKAILQPFETDDTKKRDWHEIEFTTLLMLFITDMVLNKETQKEFRFDHEWNKIMDDNK